MQSRSGYHWCTNQLAHPRDASAQHARPDNLEFTDVVNGHSRITKPRSHCPWQALPGGLAQHTLEAMRYPLVLRLMRWSSESL